MARMGRPRLPKKEHTVMASFRLKPETIRQIDALAKHFKCTKAEVIRRMANEFADEWLLEADER